MSNNKDYLGKSLPETWNKDQSSWSNSNESNNTLNTEKAHNIYNWLNPKQRTAMESIPLDHSSSEINMLWLKLQQTKNNINQLQIHLITLQAVEENDEIANKIIDIENDIENLKQEERNLETKIT